MGGRKGEGGREGEREKEGRGRHMHEGSSTLGGGLGVKSLREL